MNSVIRIPLVPSTDWTAINVPDQAQVVWARYEDDLLVTFWHESGTSTSEARYLVRTDELPPAPNPSMPVPTFPPGTAFMDYAVPYINSAAFLWLYRLPDPSPRAAEGHVTMYPMNAIYDE